MEKSILTSTKKILGLDKDYTAFDLDIITHINTALATLRDIGVGPVDGYMIEDSTPLWSDFIGMDNRLSAVKTYVYLKVRLLFDPPTTSFHLAAAKEQLQEMEWRLQVAVDPIYVDPVVEETIY